MSALRGPILGVRTDCLTDEVYTYELEFEIRPYKSQYDYYNGQFELVLFGGPTGYESVFLKDILPDVKIGTKTGWEACWGTKGRWDKLFIPMSELRRVLAGFL